MTKLENTILYILEKCGSMGRTKLECMLYFIDFSYYENYEKPMFENVEWIKGENHPELRLRKNNDKE